MFTTALASFKGTGLINEPIIEVVEYRASKFHCAQSWGPMVDVVMADGEVIPAWANEIFITLHEEN